MLKVSVIYDRVTIMIKGLAHIPFATIDPKTNSLRAQALDCSNIVNYLRGSAIDFSDYVLDLILAREALLGRKKTMDISLNSRSKLEVLKEILVENNDIKTIIFTKHNSLDYKISDKFLIPSISHKTRREERQNVLTGFKEGCYLAIVRSKVLDEGVDVPDARLGIRVSGTRSGREFSQRLGRLLRPMINITTNAPTKNARSTEIIASDTRETG